jgi:hypothetical protein
VAIYIALSLTATAILSSTGFVLAPFATADTYQQSSLFPCKIRKPLDENCLRDLHDERIAFIDPTFTVTPYDHYDRSSFYWFYNHAKYYENKDGCVTNETALRQLTTRLDKGWGFYDYYLHQYVKEEEARGVLSARNVTVLTDQAVNDGALFSMSNGALKYDVVLVGFSEYVSAAEFFSYERFVALGGKIVFESSSLFVAEVYYNASANTITYVTGHGWSYNGKKACPYPYQAWHVEKADWVGSALSLVLGDNYTILGAVANTSDPLSLALQNVYPNRTLFRSYYPHEEDAMTNSSDIPIAYWKIYHCNETKYNCSVAVYRHDYKKGVVIDTGIFGDDIVGYDKQFDFFLLCALLKK